MDEMHVPERTSQNEPYAQSASAVQAEFPGGTQVERPSQTSPEGQSALVVQNDVSMHVLELQ
jgi:hypothetical protein